MLRQEKKMIKKVSVISCNVITVQSVDDLGKNIAVATLQLTKTCDFPQTFDLAQRPPLFTN